MKFIHLSDLHIGKRVNEFSMINDQKYILEQILNIIANEEINAVIVSGDVYDKSIPAVEAVTVFDDFLTELATKDITTLIISGNHDSPERLGFGSKIMQNNGVHIYSVFDGELHKVKIDDVNFYMLPFVKPIMVRRFYPEVETYEDAVRTIIENTDIDKSQKNVILSHQFITKTGAETMRSDSESVSVGGLDNIDISVFDDFDYTALGHIHKAQRVSGRENVRYAGSPIPMSFAEKHYHHGVVMVTLDEGCAVDIRRIECPQSIPLISVPGGEAASPEKIIEILRDLPEVDGEAPYLEVKVLLEEPEPMLRQEIEEALAGKKYRLARIVSAYRQEERVEKEADGWKKGLQEMSPLQIAQSAFEKVYQTEMPADLTDLFQEAYISATRKEEEEGE